MTSQVSSISVTFSLGFQKCFSAQHPTGSACAVGGAVQISSSAVATSRRRTNDQQLQDIKEVVEEAELAQTMIHNLAQSSGSPIVTSARSVTGSSSSITSNPLHRAKSSQLHDRLGQV